MSIRLRRREFITFLGGAAARHWAILASLPRPRALGQEGERLR